MCENIEDLIKAIPGLVPVIAEHVSCQLSGGTSYQHTFQITGRQLYTAFLENADPSKFLIGIGIRLAMSPLTIVSTVNFQNSYHAMQDLHHTIRGTDISEITVMGVLVKLAAHAVTQPHHASKESQEFVELCLARLLIPETFLTVCTATEQICNYGDRRLSGASHEVACGLVLPRQVQVTFFLQDLHVFLDEVRTVYLVGFQSDRLSLHNILFILIEAFPTLINEWLSNRPNPIHFELYSLLGLLFMLLAHFQKGNPDSFYYAICLAVNDLERTLGIIRKEMSMAILYDELTWDGATYASITFGAYLDDLRKQLLHLQDHAD
ncbi:uncharacterized protein BO96DRAFT_484796 [Aspergillus niger CBS 101883]|uniref:uncharacterized protein n=1 Tax=Aspergillus lacticoffeatus (strain CBS 101883) TaxID=1450533 RepID=UPI000D7F7F82|nr:uncharacterized protein BO96DRAFT_484796 [Aspergillus niger CBS 101883]PYH52389.1 hypothetical protein BO96DRAFT_484796 [Aspergillus niger CBS 101883]